MADEDIILNYLLNADAALSSLEKVQSYVDDIKQKLVSLSQETGATLQATAASMKASFKEFAMKDVISPEGIQQAKASIQEYNQALSVALKEATGEIQQTNQALAAQAEAEMEVSKQANVLAEALINAETKATESIQQATNQRLQQSDRLAEGMLKAEGKVSAIQEAEANKRQQLSDRLAEGQLKAEAEVTAIQEAEAEKRQAQSDRLAEGQLKAAGQLAAIQEKDAQRQQKNLDDVTLAAQRLGISLGQSVEQNALALENTISQIKAQLSASVASGKDLATALAEAKNAFAQQQLTSALNSGGGADVLAGAKANIAAYNKAATQAFREVSSEAENHGSVLSNLGKIGQFVFGTVLGLSAIRILSDIRRWFSEAAQAGKELEQTIFRLEASVRGLQARGIDVSMKATEESIKSLRKEFKQFTTQELAGGIANIQLLTANFNFTKAQMDQVLNATTSLAVIMGKDLDEAARQVALFMSSGYSEGLQRAGLAVNKLTVQEEAHRLGINKSYMALTEEERAFAALNVVMRQTVYLQSEAKKYQESEAGQLQIQAKRWEELKTAIGDKFVPAMIAGYKISIEFINALLSQLGKVGAFIFNSLVTPFLTAIAVMDMWKSGAITNLADVEKAVGDVYAQLSKQVEKQFQLELKPEVKLNLSGDNPLGQKIPTDTAQNYAADLQKIFMDIVKANQKFNDDMAKAQQDFLKDYGSLTDQQLNGVFASWNNFWNSNSSASQEQQDQFLASMQTFMGKFGDITEKGLEKAAEIWQKYYDKINDINQKEQDQIAAENQKYQQQVQDLHDDTQQKLEDAARKYHDAEIKAEREFQEKMRRLREEFLFDLEDALRERDALQVLRLIRRYKLDVEQANRQYELERQERLDAYKQEIEDIKRQAAEKAKQLAEEHANRLAEIQKAAEDERKQAEEDRQKALDQLLSDMQKERDKRQEEYDAQIRQLKDEYQKQLTEMLTQYGLQLGSTQSFGDAMTQLLGSYFGPGGAVDGIYSYLGSIIQQSVAEAQAALTQLLAMQAQAQQISDSMNTQSSTDVSPGGYSDSGATGGQMSGGGNASGGLLFANTPQLAMFGEVPELVQFTPISKLNTQSMTSTGTSGTGMGSGNGKVTVRIELDSGLVGTIVDKSLNEVAASLEVARSNRR